MRKILVMAMVVLAVSCGYNKEEQMLCNYVQKGMKENLNVELSDLNFKIKNIKKVGSITGADSMKILKLEFANLWKSNPSQELIDTLSFKYVKKFLNKSITLQDTLYEGYQKLVLLSIKTGNYAGKYKYKQERNKAMQEKVKYEKSLIDVEGIEEKYNMYAKLKDSVLSEKYEATYSLTNPLLKVKQSFDKVFYTNAKGDEFVREEKK